VQRESLSPLLPRTQFFPNFRDRSIPLRHLVHLNARGDPRTRRSASVEHAVVRNSANQWHFSERWPRGGGSMHNLSLHFARMGSRGASRIAGKRAIWKFGYGPRYPRLSHPLGLSAAPPGLRKSHAREFLNSFSRAVCARCSRYPRSCLSPCSHDPEIDLTRPLDGSRIFNLPREMSLNAIGPVVTPFPSIEHRLHRASAKARGTSPHNLMLPRYRARARAIERFSRWLLIFLNGIFLLQLF